MSIDNIPAPIPSYHPDEDLLVAFAAGQLDLAYRVVLEAHLSSCSECARQIGWMYTLGGRLLEEIQTDEPPSPLWDDLERRLDQLADDELAHTPLPASARAELEPRQRQRTWLQIPFSAARLARLWIDPETKVELLLLCIDAGKTFPAHVHIGSEQVQILSGGYRDPMGHFTAGDFAIYPPASSHAPLVEDDEPCWIVTRLEQGARLSGWRGWVERILS